MSKRTTTTKTTEYDNEGRIVKTTEVTTAEDTYTPYEWQKLFGYPYVGDVPSRFAQGGYVTTTDHVNLRS